ncbi:MAG: PIN domain-containing protein [Thermodesulfobacteriota bacterium]|jgi:predicted nucleic acid-binding protein
MPTATGQPKVALDTCCVQYYISNPPVQPWADCLDPIFRAAIDGKIALYASTVVVSELLANVHFANRHNAGYDPELDLLAIMNRHFQILDVNGAVAKAAGRLRGSYVPGDNITLKTPDALIGATSLTNGHTLFVTNDAQLADALPDTNCIYLRDVALEWLAQNFPGPCLDGRGPISPCKSGKGLPTCVSAPSLELGGVQPDPSANWRRILKDAQTVASAVNEPCAFFVLTEKNGRKVETREVLFWHEGLRTTRPSSRLFKRLKDHLEVLWDKEKERYEANSKKHVHGFVFASLAREKARQNQPGFASKSDHQREADAWNGYLALWRTYRTCLDLPQVTWLLCENGAARPLDVAATVWFLDQAKNVLGWKDER